MRKISLDKILQSQGFGTRKYCRSLIEDGEVSVNGVVVVDDYRESFDTDNLTLRVSMKSGCIANMCISHSTSLLILNVRVSPATIPVC
jgi:16S rRNA U516 pseudouridylate synthase RsuA-like enzyme